jgi:sugar lactone lactonase YvrE
MIRTQKQASRFASVSGNLALVCLLAGCQKQAEEPPAAPTTPAPEVASVQVESSPPSTEAASMAEKPPAQPEGKKRGALLRVEGLSTPESVYYDEEDDVYLVSNINGSPTDVDANGFISKVSPEGTVTELKWIDGSKKDSTLNAPKGITVTGGLLYVTDITFVRMFDKKTGAPKGKLAIPGATFLNDLSTAPDGTIYVSDSGVKMGKEGFEKTGSDSVYKIVKGKVEKVIADPTLGWPNGLVADDAGVWLVTLGGNELYRVSKDGKREAPTKLPKGGLDGLQLLANGTVLTSSWESSSIYQRKAGGAFELVIENVPGPADFGWDSKRSRVLIPLFKDNAVAIYDLPQAPQ